MSRLTRTYVERFWIRSIGDEPNADHFREPPPRRRHAVCKPGGKYCSVHKDDYNPHAGVLDAIGHFFEWRGAPIVVAGLVASALLWNASTLRNQPRYTCPICGAGLPFSMLSGFSYQCQVCKNWLTAA